MIVLDLETTGLRHSDSIIELAAVAVSDEGHELGAFTTLVRPRLPVQSGQVMKACAFCGISPHELEAAPPPWVVWDAFCAWGAPFQGHEFTSYNKPFDKRFMDNESFFAPLPWASTCIMARYRAWSGACKYKLAVAAERFDVEVDGTLHRALTDARVAAAIHRHLLAEGA